MNILSAGLPHRENSSRSGPRRAGPAISGISARSGPAL